jgi:hypothetical protein
MSSDVFGSEIGLLTLESANGRSWRRIESGHSSTSPLSQNVTR